MSNKRSDFAIGATERDGRIDTGCERCDSILEEMTNDLHDGGFVLNNSDIGGVVEFADTSDGCNHEKEKILTKRHLRSSLLGLGYQSR